MAKKETEFPKVPPEKEAGESGRMPFTAHLQELRWRLVRGMIAIAIGFGICYYYSKPLFHLMMLPLLNAMPEGKKQLIYTGLPEAFFTYMKVGFWGGMILVMPYLLYQAWCFIAPGLYRNEKGALTPFVFFSTILFIVGGAFGYFIVFPYGFKFFLAFSEGDLLAMPSVKEYFGLSLKLLFGFGIIFQLPLVMIFLAKIGLVNAPKLSKGRKWAVLLIFIVAAILTPPDVISQLMMAAPLLVLYEISIILVRIMNRKKEKAASEETLAG